MDNRLLLLLLLLSSWAMSDAAGHDDDDDDGAVETTRSDAMRWGREICESARDGRYWRPCCLAPPFLFTPVTHQALDQRAYTGHRGEGIHEQWCHSAQGYQGICVPEPAWLLMGLQDHVPSLGCWRRTPRGCWSGPCWRQLPAACNLGLCLG